MPERFEFPEGATPIGDCSGLIPVWVHHLNDLNRVEAENILNAQRKYLQGRIGDPFSWFQVKELKAIHQAMFGNVWEWAGVYRKSITSIGIDPSLIPKQLAELCFEVSSWSQYPVELTFVEKAVRVHHRTYIHGEKGYAIVKALLRSGSSPNDQTLNGHRVLQLAVKAGLEEIIKLLATSGADVDAKDKSGLTPFQVAVGQENKVLADFFLSQGAKQQAPPGIGYEKYYKLYLKPLFKKL